MSKAKQTFAKTLVADARKVAASCAGIAARRAARRITRFLEARLVESGLGFAQFALLVQIAAAARDDSIGALAERAGLDQSTLSRNLRGLERAGLIEIATVEADLRRRAVWLTERGARRLADAIPVWRRARRELSKTVASRDALALAAAADRLAGEYAGKGAAGLQQRLRFPPPGER